MELKLRNAVNEDADLIFEWANDPLTRANSFNKEQIKYEDHLAWYEKIITDPNTRFFICMEGEKAVGQVRLKNMSGKWLISYSIAASSRGKGLATKMLSLVENKIDINEVLIAEVLKDNSPSINIFRKLSYEEIEEEDKFIFVKKKNIENGFC